MLWQIKSGPAEVNSTGFDAVTWRWVLRNRSDKDEISVLVAVSGTAAASAAESLPDATAEAIRTQGRSEIEKVLDSPEPPRLIELDTTTSEANRRWSWIADRAEEPA
jgi:hypothetical protein